jgi:SAM-dependent methyltransferase
MVQALPETWDEVARHYVHEIVPAERDLAEEIANLLDGIGLRPPARLIEIGAGSGHLSLLLQQRGYETTLLDFSPVALEHARTMYAAHGQAGGGNGAEDRRFILGDAFALPAMGLGGFDLAWNSGVCEHFDAPRLERILRAMASVAGRVLVIVPNPDSVFYLAGRRRAVEQCNWAFGVELLRRNYEEIFRAAGLGPVRRGFLGKSLTRNWIRLAVGAEAALLFEQLLSEGQVPPRELYLQCYLSDSEPHDAMHADEATRLAPGHDPDADAFDRTLSLDALGNAMLALSKMREEVEALRGAVAEARGAAEVARQAEAAAREEVEALRGAVAEAEKWSAEAAHHIARVTGLCDELLLRARDAEAERDRVLGSTSWRITGPLRRVAMTIRRPPR